MEPDLGLEGRVVIVTGAAGGIGAEIARTFAAHGATIAAVDSPGSDGAESVKELGAGAVFLACDVCDPDAVCSMIEAVAERHGRIDILVNASAAGSEPGQQGSAGALVGDGQPGSVGLADETFSRAVSVAMDGTFYCSKYAAQRMLSRGAGCIVTVVSAAGGAAGAVPASDVAAVAGALSLSQALSLELGPQGVRVNAVSAGPNAAPVEVARAALFLASDMAASVNGSTIAVGS